MIKCPVCNVEMFEGAIYCLDCGAKMYSNVTIADTLEEQYIQPGLQHTPDSQTTIIPSMEIYLVILETGQVFTLPCDNEYIVGRITDDQPIFPEIDLTPFNGFRGGVSRLHATIKAKDTTITVTDLGSTNGTRINNVRIESNNPHQITHGDIVSFGNIKTRVLFYK